MVDTHFVSVTNFQKEQCLPSKDVIDRVLSEDHFFSMNAARVVAAELVDMEQY